MEFGGPCSASKWKRDTQVQFHCCFRPVHPPPAFPFKYPSLFLRPNCLIPSGVPNSESLPLPQFQQSGSLAGVPKICRPIRHHQTQTRLCTYAWCPQRLTLPPTPPVSAAAEAGMQLPLIDEVLTT